ncbi:hypothetical protein J6U78_03260 [bacterium]|jgi:hypothetical protein|nr:hypothetical protein [bacterium]MBR4821035.1 hypothetical protein [bacterium]
MNFLKKIPPLWLKIYRPVIYILTLVLVWMGAVNNNKLNLNVADSTGGAFDTIENLGEIRKGTLKEYEQKLEQRLKDGDASQAEIEDLKAIIDDLKHNEKGVVLICFDFDAGCDAEMTPQVATILRHCFSRGVKVLINTGGNVMSQPLAQQTIERAAKDGSRLDPPYPTMESGVDYVFLGFRPNAFQLYLQMGESIISAYETDYSGKDLSTMPIMEHIRDFRAIDCVVTVSAYVGAPETWITVGNAKFGKKVILGGGAIGASDYYPFLQSGQICGLLPGLRGAAEYESALKCPDIGSKRMWSQLYTHAFAIFLIILGNIEFFFSAKRRKI